MAGAGAAQPPADLTADAGTLIVGATGAREPPSWSAGLRGTTCTVATLDAGVRPGEHAAALIDAFGIADPFAVARQVHSADPDVQIVVVTPEARRRELERARLFAAGTGEVWIASPADVGGGIAERAAGVTRMRRSFARTRERLAIAARTESPQRAARAAMSEAILNALLNAVPDGILVVDNSRRVVSANAAASALLGREAALPGARLDGHLGADVNVGDLLGHTQVRRDVELGPETGGATRVCEVTVVPIPSDVEPLWAVLLHDVTDRERGRRQLEAQARELEGARAAASLARDRVERLQRLTAALARAVTTDDIARVVIEEALPAFEADTAWFALRERDEKQEDVLRTVAIRGVPENVARALQRVRVDSRMVIAEAVRARAPRFATVSPEAPRPEFQQSVALVPEHGLRTLCALPIWIRGEVVGALGIAFRAARDITEGEQALMMGFAEQCGPALDRVRLFAAEKAARDEAERANKAKSEFLATMSHELRTPLNAIGGYAELMSLGVRGPVSDDQKHDLERIRRSQEHLLGLINDVLNFARLEAGRVDFNIKSIPLAQALAAVEEIMMPQVQARRHALRVSCEPGLAVCADPDRLRQILVNLLTNAVKYTEPGGHIDVSASGAREGDRDVVRVAVRDDGIGIAPQKLASVFEPFVQVGRELRSPMEGVGLGLAISRDLARRMDGDLTASSAEGRGSTFTLTLPRAP